MNEFSLDQMCEGALLEKARKVMQEIADNIVDPNTKETAARKMTISLTFKPNSNRDMSDVAIEVKSSLAPHQPASTTMIVGRDEKGKAVVGEMKAFSPQVEIKVNADGETVIDDKKEAAKDGKFKGLQVIGQ